MTAPVAETYSSDADILTALGKLGPRLPVEISVPSARSMAYAVVLDRLADVYGGTVPDLDREGREAAREIVRWAEAKLAAAHILSILGTASGLEPEQVSAWREEALETLRNSLPGVRIGDTDAPGTTPGTGPIPSVPLVAAPGEATSLFPDPYAVQQQPWHLYGRY